MVAVHEACSTVLAAVAVLRGANLTGTVVFKQDTQGTVAITGELKGLSPGKHGFHVHEFGDISGEGCLAAGGHFNPYKKDHGAPTDKIRHVGDLGNIVANEEGIAMLNFTDNKISLKGRRNILGRALVVHQGVDDLGRGNATDSKTTGHAGPRAGCGVIGSANVTALEALD